MDPFTSGVQSSGASASASVPPMNIQDLFPLGLTDLTSLRSRGLSRVFYNTTVQKHQFCTSTLLQGPTLTSIRDYWKNHKWMSESEVTQSCPTCCNHMDCSLPGSSVHGIFQAIVLEWMDCHFLLQGTFLTQGSNPGLPHCRQTLYRLSHQGSSYGKTIPLIKCTFVGKVMSLLFNMLPKFVIAFLSRSKCLNFMAAVTICSDFGAQENKVSHCFHCFPIYLPLSDRTRCHDLSFYNVEF